MIDIKLTEGQKFTYWRKQHHIPLRKVAEYCGCSIAALSYWETGKRSLVDKYLLKYKEFINNYKN